VVTFTREATRPAEVIVVHQPGIESRTIVKLPSTRVDSRTIAPPRVDVSAREPVAFGPNETPVEDALAWAIEGAVAGGRWDVVTQLARELEARRLDAGRSGEACSGKGRAGHR
jgi:hypothetical protein